MNKDISIPKIGIFACFSGSSNTGSLTGMAALEVVERLGNDTVGICSLPALLNDVSRQSAIVKRIETIIVLDGCHQACASQLLTKEGIIPTVSINIENDLSIKKLGPFTSLEFTNDEVNIVVNAILSIIGDILQKDNNDIIKSL